MAVTVDTSPNSAWSAPPQRSDGPATLATLSPDTLRAMSRRDLDHAAAEVRRTLIDVVSRTGGHLGPNLGVVELTFALHRVFDSPRTPIVFDTGHQAYVHKIVTGRAAALPGLRRANGLSGYPSRRESPHDLVENSHASTALSYADGLSRAHALAGDPRPVVAVIGDGAMTGGMAWEALNNLGASERPVVVVLNDNQASYAPTVGAWPRHLARLVDRTGLQRLVQGCGGDPGPATTVGPGTGSLFQMLGLTYLGPVDGHDLAALERVLAQARDLGRPVLVHCLTQKGHGYPPAETDQVDHLHTVPPASVRADPGPTTPSGGTRAWTAVFGARLAELAAQRPDLVAVTAAMAGPTGLSPMARAFPDRVVDVGIAEQHAVTAAAGMAMAGAHPVVALYATFANRAFDQVLLDVGLHHQPVTFVLDRAGVTGPDGPSHHGMFDLALFGLVPGFRVAAPRDAATLRALLDEAVGFRSPTMLRFPKGDPGADLAVVQRWASLDLLHVATGAEVLIVSIGAMARTAVAAARALGVEGVRASVVDPGWVLPISPYLVTLAARHRVVVTVEDGVRANGVGAQLSLRLQDVGARTSVHVLGLPTDFLPHAERADLLAEHGLDVAGLTRTVAAAVRVRTGSKVRRHGSPRRRPQLELLRGGAEPALSTGRGIRRRWHSR